MRENDKTHDKTETKIEGESEGIQSDDNKVLYSKNLIPDKLKEFKSSFC